MDTDDNAGEGARPPISLSKVQLTKSAPTVSLTKKGGASGTLQVNLNWNARPPGASSGGGLFKRKGSGGIDLDLGCLYEFNNGKKGVVQALGNSMQDRGGYPETVVWLDGDDRSGSNSAGENLYVNLKQLAGIRRIMVFAFIYEGVPNWAAADGVVTLTPVDGPQIEVRLDETQQGKIMCGIAMLDNSAGELQVRREVRYYSGHQELDAAYGWGMNWQQGRK
jgi:tellurite resistance protein TerA